MKIIIIPLLIPHSSIDIFDIHRKYYQNGKRKYQLEIEKGESDLNIRFISSDYYNLQPLPFFNPLLCNMRLIDTYIFVKKHKSEFVPTTLQSLEKLYPQINSLQIFGRKVRILNNIGKSKTMKIKSQSINSQTNEEIVSNKCITSETASVIVRSDFHLSAIISKFYSTNFYSISIPYSCT